MADIYLKKENLETDFIIDIFEENNDIMKDESYVTASILSIFTDASKKQIGEQIDGKTLGNRNYFIEKLSEENIKLNEDGVRDSLQWLIDDGIVTKIDITSTKIGNRLDRNISFTTAKGNNDNLIYSLDENLKILDI